jgi:hypothetical protein
MVPDISARIASSIRALSEVVAPAVPDREEMAKSQLGLAIAHLSLIVDQLTWYTGYQVEELNQRIQFHAELTGESVSLTEGVVEPPAGMALPFDAIPTALDAIRDRTSSWIKARVLQAPDSEREIVRRVAAFEQSRADRARFLFKDMGFEDSIARIGEAAQTKVELPVLLIGGAA